MPKKPGKPSFKKIIRKIHLWLGLSSGIIVFVLGLTGCILTFEDEIRWMNDTNWEKQTIPEQDTPRLSTGELFREAKAQLPADGKSLVIYSKSIENTPIQLWHLAPTKHSETKEVWMEYTLNPYTGKIIDSNDWNASFWGWMFQLHTSLFLPHDVGEAVVGYATLIFVIMLITGLILWFPKGKSGKKQAFNIKWGARPKKLNYDLHNVLGFYMTWIVIFIAFSGLIFSFEWFKDSFIFVATGGKKLHFERSYSEVIDDWEDFPERNQEEVIDQVISRSLDNYKNYDWYTVNYPMDSAATIYVNVRTLEGTNYDRKEGYAYDRYSGKLLTTAKWGDQSAGERILYLNRSIHTGQVGGLGTKILAFLASLIATSLPITGFYIWWGKRKR